ncbi:MAG TPA: glycosyltransferase family 2 protein [Planctomycetota bacterium]|nr:glycosyltransferase family 2 protein [Planctomycetota bacterium]
MASDITVVVPAYNAARYIDETLATIFAQTLQPDEIIVVDDCSKDDTVERVRRYGNRIRLIRCSRNSGGCGTPRNIGIDAAKTNYIVPFDSDDLMHPKKLERHMDCVRAVPEAGFWFTDFIWHNAPEGFRGKIAPHCGNHNVFKSWLLPRGEGLYLLPRQAAFDSLMHDNYIGASSLMVTKRAWRAVGGYNRELGSAEDLDFSLRMAEKFDFGYTDEVLYRYRIHDAAMSRNKLKILNHAVRVLAPYWNRTDGDARRGLRRQLGEMEIDLIWHSIDAGRFHEAGQHWWRALCYGGLWRHKAVRISLKLALHALLTARRQMATALAPRRARSASS